MYRSESLQNTWQDNCVTSANHLCPAGPPVLPVKFWDNSFLLKALCYCVGLQYCSSCTCAMHCPTRAWLLAWVTPCLYPHTITCWRAERCWTRNLHEPLSKRDTQGSWVWCPTEVFGESFYEELIFFGVAEVFWECFLREWSPTFFWWWISSSGNWRETTEGVGDCLVWHWIVYSSVFFVVCFSLVFWLKISILFLVALN